MKFCPVHCLLLSAASAAALCAVSVRAEGVPAGSVIQNTATASFTHNGVTQTVDSNIVSITVNETLDAALASQDGGPITSSGDVVLRFLLSNTGNGPETFNLVAEPAVAGNDFDLIVDKIAIDTNANGVYDDGIDTVIPGGAATPSLDADASIAILVVALVPASATDGQNSQLQLTAQAATGTGSTLADFTRVTLASDAMTAPVAIA
ncbi:hypothetical protein N0B51_06515 [Tsuneonella sp. YG55]|uniref:DUF11 domain-containing protein n=1 Tax=Tsuneonella litorea TaxID=2976475 RepID=A0A9X2W166_9SPHN|nr:hypothetical protein [Tsuneonella litorea]MCT2558629.1 hypothetical protein [Tsuneonella litorea]